MSAEGPVYLDYAATTPVDPRVAARMVECLCAEGTFGNPASMHSYGRAARARVEAARVQVAALIGARAHDVIFTSGRDRGEQSRHPRHGARRARGARRAGAARDYGAHRAQGGARSVPPARARGRRGDLPGARVAGPHHSRAVARRRCGPRPCWSRSCTPTTRPARCRTSRPSARCAARTARRCTSMRRRVPASCPSTWWRWASTCCHSPPTSSTVPRGSARSTCRPRAAPACSR